MGAMLIVIDVIFTGCHAHAHHDNAERHSNRVYSKPLSKFCSLRGKQDSFRFRLTGATNISFEERSV